MKAVMMICLTITVVLMAVSVVVAAPTDNYKNKKWDIILEDNVIDNWNKTINRIDSRGLNKAIKRIDNIFKKTSFPDNLLQIMFFYILLPGFVGGLSNLSYKRLCERYGYKCMDDERISDHDMSYKIEKSETFYMFIREFFFSGEYLLSGFMGMSGAIGIVLIFEWSGKLQGILNGITHNNDNSLENSIYLISLAFISGLFSMRLLPSLWSNFSKILQNVNQIKEEQKTIKDEQEESRYARAITVARTALDKYNKRDNNLIKTAIGQLEKIKSDHRDNRLLYIFLSRLYRRQGDNGENIQERQMMYDKAISVLKEFINNINTLRTSPNDNTTNATNMDKGDSYYNIACYYNLKSRVAGTDTAKVDDFKKESMEAFKQAIAFSEDNKAYAADDEDVRDLYSEMKAKGML